jgi:hypothetical protein
MTPATIAWSATLFCVFFSARIGTAFLRSNPRLFTVMALFACSWAVLLPYYALPDSIERAELLSALGGFLAVYTGGLLMLHARTPGEAAHDVVPWQVGGVYLLWVIVGESALKIPGPEGGHLFGLSTHETELSIGLLLDLAGFTAVALGIRHAAGRSGFRVLAPILVAYALAELGFTVQSWGAPQTIGAFPALYAYLFAGLKIAYTLIFGSIVGYIGMPEKDRQMPGGVLHWVLIFFYLRHTHHGDEHHGA